MDISIVAAFETIMSIATVFISATITIVFFGLVNEFIKWRVRIEVKKIIDKEYLNNK